jgi:thiol-disulfide isomerase/thioredoxin
MDRVVIVIIVLLILWLMKEHHSIKVYRFYRKSCPHCVNSQKEWDSFKFSCILKMVSCVDVYMSTQSGIDIAAKYSVTSVPTVIAVNGNMMTTYSGDRSAESYSDWVSTF